MTLRDFVIKHQFLIDKFLINLNLVAEFPITNADRERLILSDEVLSEWVIKSGVTDVAHVVSSIKDQLKAG